MSTHRVPFTDATDNIVDSDDLTFNNNSNVLNIVGTTDTDQLNVSGVSTLGVSTFTSTVSFGASVSFGDDDFAKFGHNGDLSIYHDSGTDQSTILSSKKISLMSAIGIEIEDESGKQLSLIHISEPTRPY